MAVDLFSDAVLNRVVPELKTTPRYLLDTYFPQQETFQTEEIFFDIESKKFRLSPFVSPLVEGQIVESLGYTAKSFKPAYIKDKRQWNPNRAFRRTIGEGIGGTMSPEERQRAQLRIDMQDQIDMLNNRLEWMAAKILTTGAVTISGEKYPTQVVSFGRTAGHTVVLTGGNKWDQTGINPWENLITWSETVFAQSGVMPRRVTMDPKAWALFRTNAEVREDLEFYTPANSAPPMRNDVPVETGGALVATVGYFSIYVYSGTYHDDTLTSQKYLPDYTVILAGDMQGVRAFGAIRDVENLNAVPYWSKSWVTQDPSIRWLLMQSAPLLVPYRIDASLSATVA
jgi:hypothetical protein